MRAKIGLLILAALLCLMVCACQATPDSAAVTSKNDGKLEAALEMTAGKNADDGQDSGLYTDSFTNTDGDISYQVALDIPAIPGNMPALRVRPQTISADYAREVAEALFGDAEIYEYSQTWSKAELEELMRSLRQRMAELDTAEVYDSAIKEQLSEQLEAALANYEAEYAAAPETVESRLCSWDFHPHAWYYDQAWVNKDDPEYISASKSEWIVAASERDGIPYIYSVCNREEEDYRMHSITCEINWDLVAEDLILGTQAPTETDMETARAEAEAMLEKMKLGAWVVDLCEMREIGTLDGRSKYEIVVTACPVYNGVKVSHQQQLQSLRTDDAFASNYYYEEIVFQFSGGHLICFEYQSPLEVVDVVNENVAILSFAEAMDKCKGQLQMRILKTEPYTSTDFYQATGKDVDVYQAELGLVRIRVKNNTTDFYLLPAYSFRATYTLFDKKGTLVFDSEILERTGLGTKELVVINAVDGSIINTELGY